MSEKHLQRLILDWLILHGHAVWLNEIPLGMPSAYSPTGRRRAANRGTADIVGCLKGGRACFLEVKDEKYREPIMKLWNEMLGGDYRAYMNFKCGNVRDTARIISQAEFLHWQHKTGALAIFAFCLEDVEAALK